MVLDPSRVLLSDRVAVVTGAAVGIGAAAALALARFGARLALCDRDAERLEETAARARALGRRVETGVLDVRDGPAVEAFVARSAAALGPLDVLVNNAGGTFRAPFLETSERGRQALVDENFTSVVHGVRAVVPHVPARGASIVNVTSIEAHRAAPMYAVYAAMKAAVANLTMSLALELAERQIRVNCVAPDKVTTPGLGPQPADAPLARAGEPDDVAGAIVFLASDLSSFVTGTTLHVDGGGFAAGGWRRVAGGGFQP